MTPIGAEGCTCRVHLYNRPFGHPGSTVVYGSDCPHHKAPEGRVERATKTEPNYVDARPAPWRPADSDS